MKFPLIFLIFGSIAFGIVAGFEPDPYGNVSKGTVPNFFYPAVIDKSPEFLSVSLNFNYYLTNFSFPVSSGWKVFYEPETFYVTDEIPPFLELTFHAEAERVAFHMEVLTGREYMALRKWPNTSFFYIPSSPYISFDMRFPYVSYILLDFGNQSVFLGRGKIRWGYWRHPVALSGVFPYLDNFTYTLKADSLTYNFTLASMNPVLTSDEWEIQSNVKPVNADPTSPYYDRVKSLVAHRLDFSIFDNFKVSLGELTIVGGKSLDLFSIDPLAILHNNFNEGYTNSMMDLQIGYTPLSGLNLYFEFALDDFAVPLTEPGDVKPTAFGLTAGLIKTFRIFDLPGYLEISYVKTTRWMYNTFLPYLKFNARYLFLSNFPVPSRSIVDYPLGFEYGPDSEMYSLYVKLPNADLEVSYLLKGPATIETEYRKELPDEVEDHLILKLNFSIWGMTLSLKIVDDFYSIGGSWRISFGL